MNKLNYKDTIEWYEKNASDYAIKSKAYTKIDFDQFNEFITLLPTKAKVLDAGCGSGRDSALFKQHRFDIVGLDLSKNLIKEAKKFYPDVNFILGNMLNLPFESNTFDGIWSHASMVHFDSDEQFKRALNELVRVLKKDGKIHILVRAKSKNTHIDQNRNYLNYSITEIKKHLNLAKLKIITIQKYNEEHLDPQKRPGEGIEWILILAKK
jgi:ubiquinone/menaquinone biosynthesis C-methylase UbiE